MYKDAFKKSPVIQVISDENNIILDVNNKFLEYFGYMEDEVIGKHTSLILSDNCNISDDEKLFSVGKGFSNIWEVKTKDGDIRIISMETIKIKEGCNLTISFDLTREGYRARQNSANIKELKKYLINHGK